jgi:CDP-diacylglycerol---glycerol-3-phosphate 3-phosphatidyltransferase
MSVPEQVIDRAKGGKEPASSKLLATGIKNWWILIIRPIEDYLIYKQIHPDVLTITTLVVSIIAGFFFHLGWFAIAGILLLSGSTFDIFDGRVARAQGVTSKHGAFFDSCVDRFSEAFIYLGLLSYFRDTVFSYIVFLILVTAMMVSYTRARAGGLGVACEVGLMQRTERIVYLGVFSILNYFVNLFTTDLASGPPDYVLKFSLTIILLFSTYTVVQRMTHVMKYLKEKRED